MKFKVLGQSTQWAGYLADETVRAVVSIRVTTEGSDRKIGPSGNNDTALVHGQLLRDAGDALVPSHAGFHPVVAESTPDGGFKLFFRGGGEMSLLLAALRDALNALDLQPSLNRPESIHP